ncbi:microtubule-binding protein MIP-T3-domain-containing protein [Zopfochytrium polystomum]|nr:microtubule-binding protein MIP-T3-domain-containing protein [Zopfochytrium polystomum]
MAAPAHAAAAALGAPAPATAPTLEDVTKKTADILARIIKKPPLTHKLLSKPPFRYLHDIFTEIIKTTGFAEGLYDDAEMVSDNVKEKDAKVSYLLKMIDLVGLLSGIEVKANPLKIVAGMDPEETNFMLQLLGKIVLKKMDFRDVVKRVRAGEHQKRQGQGSKPKQPAQPSSGTAAGGSSKQPPAEKHTGNERDPRDDPQPQAKQAPKPTASSKEKDRTAGAPGAESGKQSMPASQQQSQPAHQSSNGNSNEREPTQGPRTDGREKPKDGREIKDGRDGREGREGRDARDARGGSTKAEVEQADVDGGSAVGRPSELRGRTGDADEPRISTNEPNGGDDAAGRSATMVPKRRERPTTARLAPPKIRATETAVVEHIPSVTPNIIQDGVKPDDDEDDAFEFVGDDSAQGVAKGETDGTNAAHGGLVQKILDTKSKLEGRGAEEVKQAGNEKVPKDRSSSKREIEALRESIQLLCRSTNPLAKTMDYLQEDVDSMNKELDYWLKENKKYSLALEEEIRETRETLSPLEKKLKQLEGSIEEVLEKISDQKATLIQNEVSLQKLMKAVFLK